MSDTQMAVVIQAPKPVPRDSALLTRVATDLTAELAGKRWAAGVKFTTFGCDNQPWADEIDFCNAESLDANSSTGEIPEFAAFTLWAAETCSALAVDFDWLTARDDVRLALWESYLIAAELMTGAVTGNPSLTSEAVDIGPGFQVIPSEAIQMLEAEIAARFGNQRMTFHVHPALLPELYTGFLVEDEDPNEADLRTATGHLVSVDAGYGLFAPGGGAADEGSYWIYVSGDVQYAKGMVRHLGDAGSILASPMRDELTDRATEQAAVWFDPCSVLAIEAVTDADLVSV